MRYIGIGILAVFSYASSWAAESQPAFTGAGATCGELVWQPSVLERFPNIGVVCQSVVERDGKLYAQFKGVVQRRSGSNLYIRFAGGENVPGGDRAVKINPPNDMTFRVGNRSYKVKDAQPGQDLSIYIPGDRFAVNLGEEFVVAQQTVIEEVVPVEEPVPPAPVEPPPPAEPAQVAEVTPEPEPMVETPAPVEPPPVVTPPPEPIVTATPPPPEETPWLLYIIIAIVIIAIVVFLMRRRRST